MTSQWPKIRYINDKCYDNNEQQENDFAVGYNQAIDECAAAIKGITEEELSKVLNESAHKNENHKTIFNDMAAAVKRLLMDKCK